MRCEPPNKDLYSFNGSITVSGDKLLLDATQVILRGQVVKNTYKAWGVVVFTGAESKIMKNNDEPPPIKMSEMEKTINFQLIALFVLLFVVCTVSSALLVDNMH